MELFKGRDGLTEYLLTRHDDGTVTLAIRPASGGTWSPPLTLEPQAVGALA